MLEVIPHMCLCECAVSQKGRGENWPLSSPEGELFLICIHMDFVSFIS